MNETNELRTLLDRFYDGETTSAEEKRLHELLHDDRLPAEMAADRLLFDQLYNLPTDVPEGLQERLKRQIDGWNTVERTAARSSRIVSLRWTAAIAASLVLLFTLGTFLNERGRQHSTAQLRNACTVPQDTYSNPADAYAETEWALLKFSQSIHKGLNTMEKATQ